MYYIVYFINILFIKYYILYMIYYLLYFILYILYIVYLYIVYYILYIVYCILYIRYYILYIICCVLYIIYYIFFTLYIIPTICSLAGFPHPHWRRGLGHSLLFSKSSVDMGHIEWGLHWDILDYLGVWPRRWQVWVYLNTWINYPQFIAIFNLGKWWFRPYLGWPRCVRGLPTHRWPDFNAGTCDVPGSQVGLLDGSGGYKNKDPRRIKSKLSDFYTDFQKFKIVSTYSIWFCGDNHFWVRSI